MVSLATDGENITYLGTLDKISFDSGSYTAQLMGFRPVICLKSNTPAYSPLLGEETDILLK